MRPWNIMEQSVEVEGTKWMLEFTSAHSEALAAGEPAPDHDQHLVLRVWNEVRTRYMLIEFDRGGMVKRTSVEAAEPSTVPDHLSEMGSETDQGMTTIPTSVLMPAPPPPAYDENGDTEKDFASPSTW